MIPHKQIHPNSCFATCIASVLELPLESVPNFKQIQDETPNYDMIVEADKWLRSTFNRRLISIEFYNQDGKVNTNQVVLNRLCLQQEELVILSGLSSRDSHHCVIGKPSIWGFDIIHDPHPDNSGLVGQPYGIKWIVPVGT